MLDRPRNAKLIGEIRAAGAAIALIGDGDIAGVIHTCEPEETGIDIYMGMGGAPEGVLAAAALRCTGGQIQGRLSALNAEHVKRAEALGIRDLTRKYSTADMASGDIIFAATGVTDGSLLNGVKFSDGQVETHTVIMRSATRTVRWIYAEHMELAEVCPRRARSSHRVQARRIVTGGLSPALKAYTYRASALSGGGNGGSRVLLVNSRFLLKRGKRR